MGSLDSKRYDAGMTLWQKLGLRHLRQQLLDAAGGRVLEIGVGTGLNVPLYESVGPVVGLDQKHERLLRARERQGQTAVSLTLLHADAQQLPLATASFDTVVSTLVFCSIPTPALALAEVKRVLRPDGRFLLLEHVRGQGPISRRFTDWLHPLWFALQGECHLNRETAALVAANGFHITHQSTHGWGLLQMLAARPL